jgi:glutamate carboxypeptidase
MDPAGLRIDTGEILATLRDWVHCESPTYDPAAVAAMMALARRTLAPLAAAIEDIPGRDGFGPCLRATITPGSGVLILAHLDTVHPVGTLRELPWRIEGDRCFGPGALDMKGGTVLAIEALRALRRAGVPTGLPVTILLTSDEEVGSPSTRALIEAEAARHRLVLVPEPGRPGNGVVSGRYAIARFAIRTVGRPSHAGARLAEGRSAIREMAQQILAIEAMTTEDCTFSVGVVQGGQWVNCVATTCTAQALSMAKRQADLDRGVAAMLALRPQGEGVRVEVSRGVTRPVWEPDAGVLALFERAAAISAGLGAAGLGEALSHGSAGGGSDGNFTGAMGIPTLDGLGPLGAGAHTLEEHVSIPSLVPRARLLAGLLATAG